MTHMKTMIQSRYYIYVGMCITIAWRHPLSLYLEIYWTWKWNMILSRAQKPHWLYYTYQAAETEFTNISKQDKIWLPMTIWDGLIKLWKMQLVTLGIFLNFLLNLIFAYAEGFTETFEELKVVRLVHSIRYTVYLQINSINARSIYKNTPWMDKSIKMDRQMYNTI